MQGSHSLLLTQLHFQTSQVPCALQFLLVGGPQNNEEKKADVEIGINPELPETPQIPGNTPRSHLNKNRNGKTKAKKKMTEKDKMTKKDFNKSPRELIISLFIRLCFIHC